MATPINCNSALLAKAFAVTKSATTNSPEKIAEKFGKIAELKNEPATDKLDYVCTYELPRNERLDRHDDELRVYRSTINPEKSFYVAVKGEDSDSDDYVNWYRATGNGELKDDKVPVGPLYRLATSEAKIKKIKLDEHSAELVPTAADGKHFEMRFDGNDTGPTITLNDNGTYSADYFLGDNEYSSVKKLGEALVKDRPDNFPAPMKINGHDVVVVAKGDHRWSPLADYELRFDPHGNKPGSIVNVYRQGFHNRFQVEDWFAFEKADNPRLTKEKDKMSSLEEAAKTYMKKHPEDFQR